MIASLDRPTSIVVPPDVVDLDSFLDWIDTAELPEKTRLHFIEGETSVDDEMEEAFSHNQLKTFLFHAITSEVLETRRGMFFTDGMLVVNRAAGLSCEPDGMFVLQSTLDSGRLEFARGKRSKGVATRVVGTPDVVIEILSDGSVEKDEVKLYESYWKAGIPEYWLLDARADEIRFDLNRHGAGRYEVVEPVDGWRASGIFGKSIRIDRTGDEIVPYRVEWQA